MQEFTSNVAMSDQARNEKFDIFIDSLVSSSYYDRARNETFSQAGFNLILDRSPTKFLMNIYIPTFLLTIASFIGFLIPVELVPGRMALLVTIFLMLVNMSTTEQNRGPIVRFNQANLTRIFDISFIIISDTKLDCNGHLDVHLYDLCISGKARVCHATKSSIWRII